MYSCGSAHRLSRVAHGCRRVYLVAWAFFASFERLALVVKARD
jgi:hypothetical protein